MVEADIKSYFDTVNHAWLVRFLRHRIGDERVIRLVIRMLKSGILEDGLVQATEQGTPQGSMLSPLLSNIYLHYVLDLWFSRRVRPGGEAVPRALDPPLDDFAFRREDADLTFPLVDVDANMLHGWPLFLRFERVT